MIFGLIVLMISCNNPALQSPLSGQDNNSRTSLLIEDTLTAMLPELQNRNSNMASALHSAVPVLLLQDPATTEQENAERIALLNIAFTRFIIDSTHKTPYRNEIFNVYKARESDFIPATLAQFRTGNCYKVEMYNYALNLTSVALVNIQSRQVIDVMHLTQSQPEIPSYLKNLAIQIAASNNTVQKTLGFKPGEKDAVMSATKTALNRSYCERSMHLCVAPTFVKDDKALWVIVDLTDMRVAGLRWTNTGNNATPVSERRLQNESVTECCCKTEIPLERNGWKMGYILTSSDGLRISAVRFNNQPVLSSAKLVDWHVSYSNSDGFGYSDAVGCPYFSTAAVIAKETPKIYDLLEEGKKTGFVLEQNFYSEGWPNACNYNYQQRYEFYDDGRFRVVCASLGRGCGNDGTYRPVLRVAFSSPCRAFSEWSGKEWKSWEKEQWQLQGASTPYTTEGYQFKIENGSGLNYYVEPGRGQFRDGGRGDRAWTFISINKPGRDEGESDLVTIGPCCNSDYHQGPEKFIEPNPEPLAGEALVLWYVPQLKNDDTRGNEYCWAESYVKEGVLATRSFPCSMSRIVA